MSHMRLGMLKGLVVVFLGTVVGGGDAFGRKVTVTDGATLVRKKAHEITKPPMMSDDIKTRIIKLCIHKCGPYAWAEVNDLKITRSQDGDKIEGEGKWIWSRRPQPFTFEVPIVRYLINGNSHLAGIELDLGKMKTVPFVSLEN